MQPGGIVVITAKSYGVTNLVALDRTGAMLMEYAIQVIGPSDQTVWSIAASSGRPIAARRIANAASRSATRPYFAATQPDDARNTQAQRGRAPSQGR